MDLPGAIPSLLILLFALSACANTTPPTGSIQPNHEGNIKSFPLIRTLENSNLAVRHPRFAYGLPNLDAGRWLHEIYKTYDSIQSLFHNNNGKSGLNKATICDTHGRHFARLARLFKLYTLLFNQEFNPLKDDLCLSKTHFIFQSH